MIATPPPITDQARELDSAWSLFLWIGAGVGLLVIVLIAIVVIRDRRRDDVLPRQIHQHIPLELAYTVLPLLIVAGLFGVTLRTMSGVDDTSDDVDVEIAVTGYQWQWRFDYVGRDVVEEGSAGVVPELVLPAGARVRFELTALDVIHSFWIPGFRFKRDMFPGATTEFEVDVGDTTGFWENSGACAEFCGLDHHKMMFSVRVVEPDEFATWIADHPHGATTTTTTLTTTSTTSTGGASG
ncbi:hypothetical protein BH24ACT5_BH24ACT5_07180 [soil metagenome]